MLIQNLRGRVGSRLSGNREAGFTLVELLVVMLILGILAAIAIPAFFNQKSKANDAKAKAVAHTAQVAMETCATDNNGSYSLPAPGCNLEKLQAIEPSLPGAPAGGNMGLAIAGLGPSAYTITVTAATTGNTFQIARNAGVTTYVCTVTSANRGGCPGNGVANGVWGS